MRLISLVGVLAAALLLGACQVRNTARCQLPDYPCDKDRKEVCRIEDPVAMTGTCQAECQKGVPTSCPQDKPVCGDDGACRACSADSDCQAYNPALGRCVQSKCVACKVATAATDCTDVNKPACDAPTGTCRACALHSECADGICVKDDTLKNLPTPLSLGQCVPASRQIVVTPACTGACSLNSQLMNVSRDKPYLRLSNFKSTTLMININKPADSMLPNIHIVTDNADVSPAQLTAEPGSSVENNTGLSSAIQVNNGADVIMEGLTILRSTNGLVCGMMGAPSTATYKVKLIRSIFTANTNALITYPGCELSISDSWFGPHPAFTNPTGNIRTMDLDSTTFEIVNTVFLKNGDVGKFSGIRINNTDMKFHPGRIINSTFARNEWSQSAVGINALAVHCNYRPGASLTILNSLFLNDTPPSMGNVYVASDCFLGTSGGGMNIAYNGSDSPIAGTGSVSGLVIGDVLTEPRTDPGVQTSLRIKQAAAASVRKGVGMYTDAQGPVPVPTRDMDGRARASTNVTLGAFEAAP